MSYAAVGHCLMILGALGSVFAGFFIKRVSKHPDHPMVIVTQLSVGLMSIGTLISRPALNLNIGS